MYVCMCEGITDSQIKKAASNGCTSMRELSKTTGVGTQCGRCVRTARNILREHSKSAGYIEIFIAEPA